jgi:hypothetical protein
VQRLATTAALNLTRVPGDALVVTLLAGVHGDVAWLRMVSGPSLSLDLGVPASGAAGSLASDSLVYIPASWTSGALSVQR